MARSRKHVGHSSSRNREAALQQIVSARRNDENKNNDCNEDDDSQCPDNIEDKEPRKERSDDEDDDDAQDKECDNAPQISNKNASENSCESNTALQIRKMQEEIKFLQENNIKMKRIIKRKKYDEAEGEYVVRKLVAMQKTTLIKYVKNVIFPNVKNACNELLFNKPTIVEKCFHHLGIKSTSDQQALRDDLCGHVKYSLCQKRKYVKERLRLAFTGEFVALCRCFGLSIRKNNMSHRFCRMGSFQNFIVITVMI